MTENENKIAYSLEMMVNKALRRVYEGGSADNALSDLTEWIKGLIESIRGQ